MENQHKQIRGYRDLTPEEIALMNGIKTHGAMLDELHKAVVAYLVVQRSNATDDAELKRLTDAETLRWTHIARTHFQEGLMALTRAVAQPTSF